MEQQRIKQLIKGVKEMRAHMAGEHIAGIQITTLNSPNAGNPHQGSNFDDFLKEEGIYEAVTQGFKTRSGGASDCRTGTHLNRTQRLHLALTGL